MYSAYPLHSFIVRVFDKQHRGESVCYAPKRIHAARGSRLARFSFQRTRADEMTPFGGNRRQFHPLDVRDEGCCPNSTMR